MTLKMTLMEFDTLKGSILVLAAALVLGACGVRDEEGEPGIESAMGEELNVRVLSDRNNIPTGGSDVATITALVTNENNQAVAAQPIEVSATGGVLQSISTETDVNGEATATLALAQDYENKDIVVTVSAGGYSGSVQVSASGSTLDMAGPSSLVLGNGAAISATLTAGNGQPIANRELQFASQAGNIVTPTSAITDSNGHVEISVSSLNGDDEITATALNGTVRGMHSFNVATDILRFEDGLDGKEMAVGEDHAITVNWESLGVPIVGQLLRFGLTAGEVVGATQVITDANGDATAFVNSSSAGPATITVEANEGGDPATQIDVEFVALSPSRIELEASSTRIQTRDTSTLTALVTDINGNPVKGRTVVFGGDDLKGGQISPASAVTNSAGEASVMFTAGGLATEVDEITLNATVKDSLISASKSMSIVERRLNVTLGTANFIQERAVQTQYAMPFVVQVADGSGAPLKDATVEMSIHPLEYSKGTMRLVNVAGLLPEQSDDTWSADHWAQFATTVCESEDGNRNRILDAGEDVNANDELDPQDPALLAPITAEEDLATLVGSTLKTDEKGSGYFDMIYPASNSLWARVRITARAQAFNVEAEAHFDTFLPLLAARINNTEANPPNHISPYGTSASCNDTE